MSYFDDEDDDFYQEYDNDREEADLDEDEEDEETLKELDVDDRGHVIEGRSRRRNRDDEYEDEQFD